MTMKNKTVIDYTESDIYEYFGCPTEIWEADRADLLAVIGGMSGILELLWHEEITSKQSFDDFKQWLTDHQPIEVEVVNE